MKEERLFDFENLKVYQKSLDLIDDIFEVYKSLDRDYKISVGSNLVRAGLSIANNLAEGNGKKSPKEKKDILKYLSILHANAFQYLTYLKGKI